MTHPDSTDALSPGRAPRPRTLQLASAAVLAALIILHGGCGRSPAGNAPGNAAPARAPVRVGVVSPVQREIPRFVRATGTLFGDEETTIAAKVSGRIVRTSRDLGDAARPGEELARIDPTDYELSRNERRQAFLEVLASLGLTELPGSDFDVNTLPGVERARLQAENAKARYERGKVLADRKPPLISDQDYADLRTAWEVAESNLRVERLSAEAKLAEARTLQAQLRVADQRVADTSCTAPGAMGPGTPGAPSGRVYEVAERYVTVGDFVQIGTPLFRLVDPSPLKLRAQIPERRLGAVHIGQKAEVRVEAHERAFEGTISRVSPAVDVATRTFTVEVVVPNEQKLLKAGSFGIAMIRVGQESALVLPESAVLTFAGVNKVVAVVNDKAEEKRVELGDRLDGVVEIVSGVTAKDTVVERPSGALTTGMPLSPDRLPPKAPPGERAEGVK